MNPPVAKTTLQADSADTAAPANDNSTETQADNSDEPDGSFVVLLDDEPEVTAETEPDPIENETSDSESFLILFDDEEQEDLTEIEEADGNYKVALAGDISFHNISKLKSRLEATLGASAIEIDATAIDEMDTASAQMLLSYTNNLKNASVPFKWTGTSKTFDNVSQTLGVSLVD